MSYAAAATSETDIGMFHSLYIVLKLARTGIIIVCFMHGSVTVTVTGWYWDG